LALANSNTWCYHINTATADDYRSVAVDASYVVVFIFLLEKLDLPNRSVGIVIGARNYVKGSFSQWLLSMTRNYVKGSFSQWLLSMTM